MPRQVVVEFLALHVGCRACAATARLEPDCDVYATWAEDHMMPELLQAEVLVDGELQIRGVRKERP